MSETVENQKLQEQIYLDYKEKVTRYISGKVPDPHMVEDLVSGVFVKAFAALPSFDAGKASVSTWIYTITRNVVIDYYRTSKQFSELTELPAEDKGIEEQVLSEEMLERLADALLRIEKRERDLIILHYYSGHTLKVTADIMHMSYSYAKLIHGSALKKLRRLLEV